MKPIKAKKDFTIGNDFFTIGDTIEPNKISYEQIVKLNEKGFIDSLSRKELMDIRKNKNNIVKEEN